MSTVPSALGMSPETLSAADDQLRARKAAEARRWREGVRTLVIRLASLATFLIVWQVVGARIDPILFTTPAKVAAAAWTMIWSGELWQYLGPSLLVLFYGLTAAVFAGIAVGLLLARFRVLDAAFDMYITFLYSTPTVALVPLIVLWAGYDTAAKAVILFLFAFFPMVINTYQGVKNVDKKLLEVGKAFRCSEGQMWRHIIVPAALPFIVTGLRLAVGRGLIGMVIADLYTAISGIGYLINKAATTYRVDVMFVPIVTLGVLGVTLTALLRVLEKKVAPWTAAADRD
jgi:NitT/TauT family transport system permease protein